MATKFVRKCCVVCDVKKVTWKMPSFTTIEGDNRIFFCWECAKRLQDKLNSFDFSKAPQKKEMLSRGQIVKLPKIKKDPYRLNDNW